MPEPSDSVDAVGGQFYPGQGAGSGVLTIQSGGTLKTNGAFIGRSTAGAQRRVSITGAGSDWNAVVGDESGSWFRTYNGAPVIGFRRLASFPLRVPDDLPEVPVRVLEVTRVAAPERFLGGLHDDGSRQSRLGHHRIYLAL